MAVRTDLTVDWEVSPRIVTVTSPSTTITIQDLHDSLTTIEQTPEGLDQAKLVDSSGKQDLGDEVFVGVTLQLQNAKLAFEARPASTFVQCKVGGGNLVAVDENGATIDPVQTTAYTQVIKTSSSSATLTEQSSIQFSSYSGGIHIDSADGTDGLSFPSGTPQSPVKTLDYAKQLAVIVGLDEIHIEGTLTIGASESINGYILGGHGPELTFIELTSGCTTSGTLFRDLSISGRQNGETHYKKCEINALSNVHCKFEDCRLNGPITMHTTYTNTTVVNNCYGNVDINLNNSPINMMFTGYSGEIQFQNMNKVTAGTIYVHMLSGHITIESTCTTGTIKVTGCGSVTDNSNGTSVDIAGVINPGLVWENDNALTKTRFLGLK